MIFSKRKSLLRLINYTLGIVVIAIICSSISIICNYVIQDIENKSFETRFLVDQYSDELSKNNILATNASLSWQAYRFDKELSISQGTYNEDGDLDHLKRILTRELIHLNDRLLVVEFAEKNFRSKSWNFEENETYTSNIEFFLTGLYRGVHENWYPSTSNNLLEFLEEDFEVAVPIMYRMSDHFLTDYVFHLKSQLDKDYIDLHNVNALSRFIIFIAFALQITIFLTIQLFELREEEDVKD